MCTHSLQSTPREENKPCKKQGRAHHHTCSTPAQLCCQLLPERDNKTAAGGAATCVVLLPSKQGPLGKIKLQLSVFDAAVCASGNCVARQLPVLPSPDKQVCVSLLHTSHQTSLQGHMQQPKQGADNCCGLWRRYRKSPLGHTNTQLAHMTVCTSTSDRMLTGRRWGTDIHTQQKLLSAYTHTSHTNGFLPTYTRTSQAHCVIPHPNTHLHPHT